MTISKLQTTASQMAKDKGWNSRKVEVPEMIALCHSELSEALESYRNYEDVYWLDRANNDKPEGVATEFADVVIRIAHYAELLNFNLEKVIEAKLSYNETRPYRHGNKKI